MEPIAHIETPYPSKFGVPRQAGLVDSEARVIFEPTYRVAEAVRGLEAFEYIWLIWRFHLAERDSWSPTVRPPRLGGNQRMGVFATRSPFRPNPIGLSCVRLLRVEMHTTEGPVLVLQGADLVDGTPILDIKPYLPYADAHPDAKAGFAQIAPVATLHIADPDHRLDTIPPDKRKVLKDTLEQDPRPHYQHNPQRVYALPFDQWEVCFSVDGDELHLLSIAPRSEDTPTHR